MFAVANRFHVAEEHAEDFVDRFRDGRSALAEQDGFVRFEVLAPVEADTHVVLTYWESEADYEAWTSSEAFREAHSDHPPGDWFTDDNQLEKHEVVIERTPE